jgi:hypothetical protein
LADAKSSDNSLVAGQSFLTGVTGAKLDSLVWLHKDVHLPTTANSLRSWAWWLSLVSWRLAPYTVAPIFIVVYVFKLCSLSSICNGIFFARLGWLALFHNYVLFYGILQSLIAVPISLFIALVGILTIQPLILRELLNLFPRAIGATANGLILLNANQSLTISWSSIRNVEQTQLRLQGRSPVLAIKLELDQEPKFRNWAERRAWFRSSALHNSLLYLDSSGRLPDDRYYPCLWIPVEMIASEAERERLIATIRTNVDESLIDQSVPSMPALSTVSFTQMWLDELRQTDRNGVLSPGQRLNGGKYKIKNQLGSGGFSVVYQATDLAQGEKQKEVAIKEFILTIPGSSASIDRRIAGVMAEVELLKTLDHPAIVKFLDCFAQSGRMYVVLEAIEGPTLRQYAMSRLVSTRELVDISLQCCEILRYLHVREHPIFHRDLAPDNFILSGNGIKLIDFNIAIVGARFDSTLVVGKHCYMAPEQFAGTTNQSSDLYQLGATLYYLATGCDPEPLTVSKIHERRADVSPEFCAIVEKLTQQDESDRYSDIYGVIDRLTRLRAPAPINEQAARVSQD